MPMNRSSTLFRLIQSHIAVTLLTAANRKGNAAYRRAVRQQGMAFHSMLRRNIVRMLLQSGHLDVLIVATAWRRSELQFLNIKLKKRGLFSKRI